MSVALEISTKSACLDEERLARTIHCRAFYDQMVPKLTYTQTSYRHRLCRHHLSTKLRTHPSVQNGARWLLRFYLSYSEARALPIRQSTLDEHWGWKHRRPEDGCNVTWTLHLESLQIEVTRRESAWRHPVRDLRILQNRIDVRTYSD